MRIISSDSTVKCHVKISLIQIKKGTNVAAVYIKKVLTNVYISPFSVEDY